MKAILVADVNMTQDNKRICEDDKQRCPLWNSDIKFCIYGFNNDTKGCPLKPLPHKDFIDEAESYQTEAEYKAYVSGWNDCINEILGEEE